MRHLNNNRGVSLAYPLGFGPCSEQDSFFVLSRGSLGTVASRDPPIVIQMSILNKVRGVSLAYPSGFGPCSEQDPLFCSEQGLPWGLWRHVTPLLLCRLVI